MAFSLNERADPLQIRNSIDGFAPYEVLVFLKLVLAALRGSLYVLDEPILPDNQAYLGAQLFEQRVTLGLEGLQ